MLRRYFIFLSFVLLFALTQQAAVTHEISHISDAQQSSQKQEKSSHTNFCEKCLSFSDLSNLLTSPHFSAALALLSFDLTIFSSLQTHSSSSAVYSARAPPLHAFLN
jgi:hypothetical protein